ncbi:MAG: hypothetical protein GC171_09480 [Terrimonas sp.]|nr:hypothetical protein [Terrimonas sp.]
MKKFSTVCLACFLLVLQLPAQNKRVEGNGKPVTYSLSPGAFDRIHIDRQVNKRIRVEAGASETAVQITIDENLRDYLQVKNENGDLFIYNQPLQGDYLWVRASGIAIITIKVPVLNRLYYGCNGDLQVAGVNNTRFTLINNANGRISFEGTVKELEVESNANGEMVLKGNAEKLVVKKEGNGHIQASELNTDEAWIHCSGNGSITVNAKTLRKDCEGYEKVRNIYRLSK